MDIDFHQTLTDTAITNPIIDNHLTRKKKLNYNKQQFILVNIRTTDNRQSTTFVC